MILRLKSLMTTDTLKMRALKGTAVSMASTAAGNVLRLASNMILTRILFPEAFGLMAILQVVLLGFNLLSDVGLHTSIMQNKRGDDPVFLDTIWGMSIIRGAVIWLAAVAIAYPMAQFYGDPRITAMMPVIALSSVISGFLPTKTYQASRHIQLRRPMQNEILSQAASIAVTIALALALHNVWALVLGSLVRPIVRLVLDWIIIPGRTNRLRMERVAFWEVFHYGKFILVSTMATFLIGQGDRAILGKFLPLDVFGIYSIGFYLGTISLTFSIQLHQQVVFPLYRMRPPGETETNKRNLNRMRRLVIGGTLAMSALAALLSVPLVDILYDPRYAMAGPMIVLFSATIVPRIIEDGYNTALLALGDSRRALIMHGLTALLQLVFIYLGLISFGLIGAILAPALATTLTYPLQARFANHYDAWDGPGDALLLAASYVLIGATAVVWRDEIASLLTVIP